MGQGSNLYKDLADYTDKSMTKAVLGHTGASDSTAGKLGGEDMASDVRSDLVKADAVALEDTLRREVLSPLTIYNFGPDTAVPFIKFDLGEQEDLQVLAATYETLGNLGLPISHEYLYKRFNVPAPKSGDTTTKPGAPAAGGGDDE